MSDNPIRDFYVKHVDKLHICPRLECADSFTMSVQASHLHCCQPKKDLKTGDYSHWEVSFPSIPEIYLRRWGVDLTKPCDTIYDFVPTEIINEIIAKHGGIKGKAKSSYSRNKRGVLKHGCP